MTSGIPLAEEEKQYIRDHITDGPAQIAHTLSCNPQFHQHNQGNRLRKTVRQFIYREKNRTETVLKVRIPAAVLGKARERGISEEEMRRTAHKAILKKVGAPV